MSFPSRYPGRCATCAGDIATGEPINYDRATKKATHARCGAPGSTTDAKPMRQEGDGYQPSQPASPEALAHPPSGGSAIRPPARKRAPRAEPLTVGERVEAWKRTLEHGRADVVLCERCGGSAAGRPVVHVDCAGEQGEVPF